MKIELTWPRAEHRAIIPVFLPFMGCKARCVFCAQERQTGRNQVRTRDDLLECLRQTKISLDDFRLRHGHGAELAFYGGTFTALPEEAWRICLKFISECRSSGLISAFRCSTRPDSLQEDRLAELRELGCGIIELGIQSFSDAALNISGRGYGTKDAFQACQKLKKNGFILGVQLLPGMPGVSPDIFIRDIAQACSLKADLLRFYPCLVLKGTGLAKLWQEGKFNVWSLEETLSNLALAWNMARKENIPVARIGLAQDENLIKNILAGPCHPCLGSRIHGIALLYAVKEKLGQSGICERLKQIFLPEYAQGFFWGWKGELRTDWEELGLARENVIYWNKDYIEMET